MDVVSGGSLFLLLLDSTNVDRVWKYKYVVTLHVLLQIRMIMIRKTIIWHHIEMIIVIWLFCNHNILIIRVSVEEEEEVAILLKWKKK